MSFKNKREGIPMFLAGFACAAMLAALLATIPESRAETDCAYTPMPVNSCLSVEGFPGTPPVIGYKMTYRIPDCLKQKGFKISKVTKYSDYSIEIDYGL